MTAEPVLQGARVPRIPPLSSARPPARGVTSAGFPQNTFLAQDRRWGSCDSTSRRSAENEIDFGRFEMCGETTGAVRRPFSKYCEVISGREGTYKQRLAEGGPATSAHSHLRPIPAL
ncbi:hypothetical protein SKAU_G00417180 [Synaphobranchus kaupii]|uniref:Uncharacterized protein n=1 Tax=Synaphobranchus kaupii TaxID=118154 RepID=A0A9Q1IAS4_SYNKA|nr:hypothetical protein SKAU_G00417180 [Synaphobranchus kaupii]